LFSPNLFIRCLFIFSYIFIYVSISYPRPHPLSLSLFRYFLETTSLFLDLPDNSLADLNWNGDAKGNSFFSDPVGTLNELYEPQAPHIHENGHGERLMDDNMENNQGILGQEIIILNVESIVDNYQESSFQNSDGEQWDP